MTASDHEVVSFSLPSDVAARLDEIARDGNLSPAEFVALAVKAFLLLPKEARDVLEKAAGTATPEPEFSKLASAEYLDLAPIAAPMVEAEPDGQPEDFFEVVSRAGMRNVVSTNNPPDVRIHDGPHDFKVVRPGTVVCCIADQNLPREGRERYREILRRLAYGSTIGRRGKRWLDIIET